MNKQLFRFGNVIVYLEGEENETDSMDSVESDISRDESGESGGASGDATAEVVDYTDHFTLIEQQLTGIICFMGVFLGAYLIHGLFERLKS